MCALQIAIQCFKTAVQERPNRQHALSLSVHQMFRRPAWKQPQKPIHDSLPPLPNLLAKMRLFLSRFFFHIVIVLGDGGVRPPKMIASTTGNMDVGTEA